MISASSPPITGPMEYPIKLEADRRPSEELICSSGVLDDTNAMDAVIVPVNRPCSRRSTRNGPTLLTSPMRSMMIVAQPHARISMDFLPFRSERAPQIGEEIAMPTAGSVLARLTIKSSLDPTFIPIS